MTVFSFAANPFVVLPVSLRASHEDVEEAARKRLEARPQDWSAVARARTLLREPDSRLAAELAWFIDVGPREAATLLQAMAGGEAALLPALKDQPPLSRANVAADASARLKSTALLEPLADAYGVLDVEAVGRVVNDIHAAIPMDAVTPEKLRSALGDLTAMHAAAALEVLAAQGDPAAALAALRAGHGASAFMDELGRQFAQRFPAPVEAGPSPEDLAAAANSLFASEPEPAPRAPMWDDTPAEDVIPSPAPAPAPVFVAPTPAPAPQPAPPPVAAQAAPAQPAAARAPAFGPMERPMTFSAPKRFHEKGNSDKVRLGLMAGGGVLTLTLGVWLMAGKLPDPFQNKTHHATAVAVASPVPPPPVARGAGRHHKKTCLSIGNSRSTIAGQWCEQ